MPFLLLITFFFVLGLLYFLSERLANGSYTTIRLAFIYSLLTTSGCIWIYNELFSVLNLITSATALYYWLLLNLIGFALIVREVSKNRLNRLLFKAELGRLLRLEALSFRHRLFLALSCIFLFLPLLFLAVYAPPSNLDSHNYHLNRILYWIWNQNLDHFPTMHMQQLYHNVFAEYIVLHTFLLSGSDVFANLVQFGAMVGSIIVVSLLAKQIRLDAKGQVLAAVFQFCLPIGLFESTTTQNDYVACYFFLSFVFLGYYSIERRSDQALFFAIISLFFGGFTKYTVFFFALPFALHISFLLLKQFGFLYSLKALVMSLLLFAFIFSPFFARNYQIFGNILSPKEETRLAVEKIRVDRYSPAATVSNVVKNLCLHIGLPSNVYNRYVDSLILKFHRFLGVALYDPAISLNTFYTRFSMQEDMAPNTAHFLLILLTTIILFTQSGNTFPKLLILLALSGFVLFSSVFKFQFWSSRTQMPFFAIGCVVAAFVYRRVLARSDAWSLAIMFLLSITVVYGNPNKRLLPLRYLSKRLMGHIPRDICPVTSYQALLYRASVSQYYTCTDSAYCYPLRQFYSYADRRIIFNRLDSLDYFHHDKQDNIMTQNRTESYFASHVADYESIVPLLNFVHKDVKNVGVLFKGEYGFYHYWCALAAQAKHQIQMRYIRFRSEFLTLKNSKQPFEYNYILADDSTLVNQVIPIGTIAATYKSNRLILIRLKQPSNRIYLY